MKTNYMLVVGAVFFSFFSSKAEVIVFVNKSGRDLQIQETLTDKSPLQGRQRTISLKNAEVYSKLAPHYSYTISIPKVKKSLYTLTQEDIDYRSQGCFKLLVEVTKSALNNTFNVSITCMQSSVQKTDPAPSAHQL